MMNLNVTDVILDQLTLNADFGDDTSNSSISYQSPMHMPKIER